jgi:hypothetical protein
VGARERLERVERQGQSLCDVSQSLRSERPELLVEIEEQGERRGLLAAVALDRFLDQAALVPEETL